MGANSTSFKTGNSGGGRSKGSRNKLSESFIKALADDFEINGKQAIEDMRKVSPAQYNNVIAKLMPKLMELSGPDGGDIPLNGRVTFVRSGD